MILRAFYGPSVQVLRNRGCVQEFLHAYQNKCNFHCPSTYLCSLKKNDTDNYFHKFSLQVNFDIDVPKLLKKFHALQVQWHPDKFASKSKDEQDLAARESSSINTGYRILKDPLKRSLYMLEMAGFPLEEGTTQVDTEFLMEIMEINEELADVTDPKKMEAIKRKNKEILQHLQSSIAAAFAVHDYPEARKIAARMKYYANISAKVNHFERERGL